MLHPRLSLMLAAACSTLLLAVQGCQGTGNSVGRDSVAVTSNATADSAPVTGSVTQVEDGQEMAPPTLADSAEFSADTVDAAETERANRLSVDSASDALKRATGMSRVRATATADGNDDVNHALLHVQWAANDRGSCKRALKCLTHFNSVGVTFKDGSFGPFAKVWRGMRSGRSCIENALAALKRGQRGLAVEWVMASQVHNDPVRRWLHEHPDAVIGALILVRM